MFSAASVILGMILFQVNYEHVYCSDHPHSSSNMRVPDGCYFEPSTLAVVLGNTGFWLLLLGGFGVVASLIMWFRHELTK